MYDNQLSGYYNNNKLYHTTKRIHYGIVFIVGTRTRSQWEIWNLWELYWEQINWYVHVDTI